MDRKISAGMPMWHSAPIKPNVAYICDARRNDECDKTNCYFSGGTCKHTLNPKYAMNFRVEFTYQSGVDCYVENEYPYREKETE